MPRWRVDYVGKKGQHLGTVEAPDEKSAIAEAVKTFHITPADPGQPAMSRQLADGLVAGELTR